MKAFMVCALLAASAAVSFAHHLELCSEPELQQGSENSRLPGLELRYSKAVRWKRPGSCHGEPFHEISNLGNTQCFHRLRSRGWS
uniref:Pancreatic trypsin inhibitor n=1 Tax=Rhipicephalus zambeziensis TaxID=60191 RepID=A0A224YDH4_9ACAR